MPFDKRDDWFYTWIEIVFGRCRETIINYWSLLILRVLKVLYFYSCVSISGEAGYFSRCSDSVRATRFRDRIPVGKREQFCTLLDQPRGPLGLLYDRYRFFSSGKKGVAFTTHTQVELYFFSPSGPLWPFLGWALPLPLLVCISVELFYM